MGRGEDLEFFQNYLFFGSSCKVWEAFLPHGSLSRELPFSFLRSQILRFAQNRKQFSL